MKNKILFLFVLFFVCSCQKDIPKYEDIYEEKEFKLFKMLDNFPVIKDCASNIDQHEFNILSAKAINANSKETVIMFFDFYKLIPAITSSTKSIKNQLNRIIKQDELDNDDRIYSKDFYNFLDNSLNSDYDFIDSFISILNRTLSYFYDNHLDELEDKISIIIEFLEDNKGQNIKTVLDLIQEGLVKIFLLDDKNMIVNAKDSKLGNSVKGIDVLFSSLSDIFIKDKKVKDKFINIIYSFFSILSVEIEGKRAEDVFKDLIINLSNYASSGGEIYENNKDYHEDSTGIYVNANLINGIKEMWPGMVSLFVKSSGYWENKDLDFSVIHNLEGESVAEYLTHQFYQLKETANIDISNRESGYGNGEIEKSILRMLEYNSDGERITESNNKVSILDHTLFTLAAAYNFGFLTKLSSVDEPSKNHDRGHGFATGGVITLNDTMYSMTTGIKIDALNTKHNAYNLALDKRTKQADYLFRSYKKFNKDTAHEHKFYMGYDFPALALLNGFSVGDAGMPNGGNSVKKIKSGEAITDISNISNVTNKEDYKTFYSRVENGLAELNTSRWLMGWIARACWEGEGPYYSIYVPNNKEKEKTINVNGEDKKVSIYYLPSGEIYALVDKNNSKDRKDWTWYYPKNKNDKDDLSSIKINGEFQRSNYYKESWKSDYYLFKSEHSDGDDVIKYYSPTSVVGSIGEDKYLMAKYRNKKIISEATSNEAGAIWYYEKIKENDIKRECKTQEEAMFRNFQWLMLEKKMVFFIPMRAAVHAIGSFDVDTSMLNIIEANGVLGISNAKKGSQNAYWNIKKDEGLDIGQAQKETGLNYGDSHELGDSRVVIFMKEDGDYKLFNGVGDKVNLSTVFDEIFGPHHVLPDFVGTNLKPIIKMAFIEKNTDEISSDSSLIGDDNKDFWKNRNKLFPIVVALISNLHQSSFYDSYSSGHDYNYEGKHKYPLKVVRDLIFLLAQPLIRYFDVEGGRWVPRMNDEGNYNPAYAYFAPEGNSVDYSPKKDLRSVSNILTHSKEDKLDGILPLLCKTNLITELLGFLQSIGKNTYPYKDEDKTSEDYKKWGARRKLFYGLEQILTSIKTSKGLAAKRGYLNFSYPEWYFRKDKYDLDLDIILEELIGSNNSKKGIVGFVKNRPEEKDWENYYFFIKVIRGLFTNNKKHGDKYNLLPYFINIFVDFLENTNISAEEIIAIRHSLGIVLATYDKEDKKWVYHDEIPKILTKDLPEILKVYKGNYKHIFKILMAFLEDNAFVEYVLRSLKTDYKSKDILLDLYNFLNSFNISNEKSHFWREISKMFLQMGELINKNKKLEIK